MSRTGATDAGPLAAQGTFLFTDIEGSTELWERHPDDMQVVLARHDAIVRDGIRQCGGHVFKTAGDAFYAVFSEASRGLAAALHLQRTLRAEAWPSTVPIRVRMVLHCGEARERDGDHFGPALNLGARLLAMCRGGQTLLSAAVHAACSGSTMAGATIVSHGHYRLKGIEEPVEVAELALRGVECVPPADGEKAYRVVRFDDLWRPQRDVRHNLAPERDAFVGRRHELRRLAERLAAGARLVTVLGAGGTGKTRLVRRYATAWLGEWPGGVYFCDLSEARTVEGVHFAVALALGVPLGARDPGAQLGHAIAGRDRCLVILDNFEQVREHAKATVAAWLDRAEKVHFVVTSRERLHVSGEDVFPLEPMQPNGDAVELFEVRARAQRNDFSVTVGNRAVVTQILGLLDGLPLAIELAAARVRVLSPEQILERLRDRFALLAGSRGATARQATLRAAVDWSWQLLESWEQAALAQCSVFDGGFAIEAAEAVLDLSGWTHAPPVVDAIQGLVDKSLLRVWVPEVPGRFDVAEPYFGMYLSIHEFAAEQLRARDTGAAEAAERRHGAYFAGFGSDESLEALFAHGGVVRRRKLALELDNLVTACRRAILRGEAKVAAASFLAAWAVLEARGPFRPAAALGRQVAALAGLDDHHRAQVHLAVAHALRIDARLDEADAELLRGLEAARTGRDRRDEAMALGHIAMARHREGFADAAHRHVEEARSLYETMGDRRRLGVLYANLANMQMEGGRMAEARISHEAALALHREVGNRAAEGIALGNLGTLHHELGRVTEALAAYEAALLIHRETGSLMQEAITLGNLGILVAEQGRRGEAEDLYEKALAIHREIGNRRGEGVVLHQMGDLDLAEGNVDRAERRYDQALVIHREVGNRRFEGGVLYGIAELRVAQRRFEAALQALDVGERLLRQLDDRLAVAKLLCVKGHASIAVGDTAAARLALAEAESIGARLGAESGSELGRRIAGLRAGLA